MSKDAPISSLRTEKVFTDIGLSARFYPIPYTRHRMHGFNFGFIVVNCHAVYGFGQNNATFIPQPDLRP